MAVFDEIPQVVFEVKDDNGNVIYRDSITYTSIAELRADSKAEREAKFQERYDQYLIAVSTPTEPPVEE